MTRNWIFLALSALVLAAVWETRPVQAAQDPDPPDPCVCPIHTQYSPGLPPPACAGTWGITILYQRPGRCYKPPACPLVPKKCLAQIRIDVTCAAGMRCFWWVMDVGSGQIVHSSEGSGSSEVVFYKSCDSSDSLQFVVSCDGVTGIDVGTFEIRCDDCTS